MTKSQKFALAMTCVGAAFIAFYKTPYDRRREMRQGATLIGTLDANGELHELHVRIPTGQKIACEPFKTDIFCHLDDATREKVFPSTPEAGNASRSTSCD